METNMETCAPNNSHLSNDDFKKLTKDYCADLFKKQVITCDSLFRKQTVSGESLYKKYNSSHCVPLIFCDEKPAFNKCIKNYKSDYVEYHKCVSLFPPNYSTLSGDIDA